MNHIPAVTFKIHHLAAHKCDLKGTCKEFAFFSGGFLITEEKGGWFLSFAFTCRLRNGRKKICWDFGSFGIFHPQVFLNTLWAIWKCPVRQLTLHFQASFDSAMFRSYITSLKARCCGFMAKSEARGCCCGFYSVHTIRESSVLNCVSIRVIRKRFSLKFCNF